MSVVALAAFALFAHLASAVSYISTSGGNFITNSTGDRFYIIGVDYQPGGSSGFSATADPLSDGSVCLRDAILMQQLGVNTIRVYNLDANLDHNECASIFDAAGIYMLIDVNNPLYGNSLDRADPASTYNAEYMQHIFGVVEAFAPYPNTLGFFGGNEIINQNSSADAPAYIRAVVRDMREYIHYNTRPVPVGYSAADVQSLLEDTWQYLSCDLANSTYSKIDFFGLNDYEWCGDATYTSAGYDKLAAMFGSASIPVFFSEYGCNQVEPRTFTNVPVLYGPEMSALSGGLVYEYSQGTNDFGLVVINSSSEITLIGDYNNLQQELAGIDLSSLKNVNKTLQSNIPTSCSPSLITDGAMINTFDIPARPSGVDAIVSSGLPSPNRGSLVVFNSNNNTQEPATVYNVSGNQINGEKLVILDDNVANSPGLVNSYSASSGAGTAPTSTGARPAGAAAPTGSGSGSSSTGSPKKGDASAQAGVNGALGLAALAAAFMM
ncbi:hypothetical protein MBLNU457_g3022t3 [Dothideomycetes sp. NU457]